MFLFRLLAPALLATSLAACAGGASSPLTLGPANPLLQMQSTARSADSIGAKASDEFRLQPDTRLYVSNWNSTITFSPLNPSPPANTVSVFDISRNDAPLAPVTVGSLLSPSSIAFDGRGRLYVSDYFAQSVSVFDTLHGNAKLSSITEPSFNPSGLAIDPEGKLFVTNGSGGVSVFDTLHDNKVLPSITNPGYENPGTLALDATGKLYVPNGVGSVMVFDTAHANKLLTTITGNGLNAMEAIAVDARGRLFVANGDNIISVFDTTRGNAPLPTISGSGLAGPAGMVVDASGKLYVANFAFGSGKSILVFDTTNANKYLGHISGGGLEGSYSLAIQ